jgi:DNA-binding response OmpR family regulator
MAQARKILIADPDPSTARGLAPALRQRGYQVQGARDGSRALQVAILRFPDLVLFDERTPLIDARTFTRILRTNPRTEHIPVLVTGEAVDPDKVRMGFFLRKPFNHDEVLARIDQIFRKAEAARAVSAEKEIEGNLAQIPLVDLLQILSVNRRTGRLRVEREDEKAEIALAEGRVVDARAGTVSGEKALFRLLARREGQFAFVPGKEAPPERIQRRLEELVLEGLRQADELAQLLPGLPGPQERIELAVDPSEIPPGLHPVTQEVVGLLERPRSLVEVLDGSRSTDLEAASAVSALLERGYARRRASPPEAGPVAELLAPHELHALRARIARGRASGAQAVGKVILAGGGPLSRRAALARFATVPGYLPEPAAEAAEAHLAFGTVGRLTLGEDLRIDVCELPGDRPSRPLWRLFASGAVGILVLLPAEGVDSLLDDLSRFMRLPAVVCGPSEEAIPEAVRQAPGGIAYEGSDAAEALRALLAGAGVRRTLY